MSERVNEGLRNQISRRTMHEVISGARDELMKELTESLDHFMRRDVGVEVLDVRVKRIDLPPEVSSAVYDRMNSERQILARQFRATGRERSLEIRGDADRQVVVIAADAYRQAEETRGEGDAKSAAIYAAAFNQDRRVLPLLPQRERVRERVRRQNRSAGARSGRASSSDT